MHCYILYKLKSYGNQGSMGWNMDHKDYYHLENDQMFSCIVSMLSMKNKLGSEE